MTGSKPSERPFDTNTPEEEPSSTFNSPFGPGNEPPPAVAFPQGLAARYRLIRVLGSGGFANVYLAYDSVLDQEVAVKVLRLGLASQNDRDRFLLEARIGAKLRHPNIATVFDIIQTADGFQMIMEFYPGGTLSDLLKSKGAMHPRRAIDFARQVAQALAYAHRRNVVHRDVKPANVFLASEGMIKLGDFGIAANVDQHEFTQTGMIIGTPLYMAPEQAVNSRDVDPRTDIYALGLTVYHMLTGRPPRIVDLDSIPESFRRLIKQSTAAERNERLVSAEQFIAMLDQIQLKTVTSRPMPDAAEEAEEDSAPVAVPVTPAAIYAAPESPTLTQTPPPVPPPTPPPIAGPPPIVKPAPQAQPQMQKRWWLWGGAIVLGVVLIFSAGALMMTIFGGNDKPPVVASATPTPAMNPPPDDAVPKGRRKGGPAGGGRGKRFGGQFGEGITSQSLRNIPTVDPFPRNRKEDGRTPVPGPQPPPAERATPRPAPQRDDIARIEQVSIKYLGEHSGISNAVDILNERGGRDPNVPGPMRVYAMEQALTTLIGEADKYPGDAMLNLIAGSMFERITSNPAAWPKFQRAVPSPMAYLERAAQLDLQEGSPLNLTRENIQKFITRDALRRRQGK